MAFLFYLIAIFLILFFIILTLKIQVEISDLKYLRVSNKNFFENNIKTNKKIDFLIKIRIYIIGKFLIKTFISKNTKKFTQKIRYV